jgi:HlyD family secretion protein
LLDARNKVTITARIQGYLKTVNVDRNDPVKVGQVLAQLESEDIANQLAASVADAEAADRSISEARSDQERAHASAEKAKLDYDRKRGLREKNIITEGDWVATEAAFRQTQAELARSATTIAKASAMSASAEANVKLLEVRLRDATIRSPLNGVVVSRDRNVGDLLLPGTPLLQLVDPSSIVLSARFDESAMGTIAPGQSASLYFASMPTENLKGTVLRVIRLVDQETREFTIDITMDKLPSHWALGQRANVTIKAPSLVLAIVIPPNLTARRNGRVGRMAVAQRPGGMGADRPRLFRRQCRAGGERLERRRHRASARRHLPVRADQPPRERQVNAPAAIGGRMRRTIHCLTTTRPSQISIRRSNRSSERKSWVTTQIETPS